MSLQHKCCVHIGNVTAQIPRGPGALAQTGTICTHALVALQQVIQQVAVQPVLLVSSAPHSVPGGRFKNGQGSGLDGGQYRVYINGTLEIKRARPEDEGTYTCVASSMLGTAENQVRLEVKGQSGGLDSTRPRLCKG